MTTQILNRRSNLLFDRPIPTQIGEAEIAINTNPADPGLYFADSTADPNTALVKVGPTFIGTAAPNSTPSGYQFLSVGESWLDTSSTHILKLYDGASWQSVKAVTSISTGKAPTPGNGQLHYDKTNRKLYAYESSTSSWLPSDSTFIGNTQPSVSLLGDSWLDTSSTHILKLYDGTSWQSVKAVVSISSGKASTPGNGQLHYDKNDTKLYTYEQSSGTWLTDVSVGTRLLFEANYR